MSDLRDAAVAFAQRGWFILPLEPRGKKPLLKNGYLGASNDVDVVSRWWADNPRANIGLWA